MALENYLRIHFQAIPHHCNYIAIYNLRAAVCRAAIAYKSEKRWLAQVALFQDHWLTRESSLTGRMSEAAGRPRLPPQSVLLFYTGRVDAHPMRHVERAADRTATGEHVVKSRSFPYKCAMPERTIPSGLVTPRTLKESD